jgi:cystathionine beta-lyase
MDDETKCVHLTGAWEREFRSLVPPVHRGSTVVFPTVEAYQRRRETFYDGYSYGLYGTPTSRALEAQIAAIENGSRALVVPSGLAAIALTTLSCTRSGDRVLLPDSVYDPVRTFAQAFLAPLGIEATYYDPLVGDKIASLLDDRTRLVWVESPGSITMEVQDVPAIVEAAHARGAMVAADNTWATPLRFKPLDHGVDFSVTAVSKYFAGHSDVLMGVVTVRDEALYRRLRDVSRVLGYGVSPEDCSLVLRGIETLPVRLDRCESTALALARWLATHPAVLEVRHPAFESHPGHEHWRRDFTGSSGLFSVVLHPSTRPVLASAIESLKLFAIGASWGGTRSIIAVIDPPPVRTAVPLADRGPIVRFSVGLESADDLAGDLESAFRCLSAEADAETLAPLRHRA